MNSLDILEALDKDGKKLTVGCRIKVQKLGRERCTLKGVIKTLYLDYCEYIDIKKHVTRYTKYSRCKLDKKATNMSKRNPHILQ